MKSIKRDRRGDNADSI